MKNLWIVLLVCLLLLVGCGKTEPEKLLPEGKVLSAEVVSLPKGYEYAFGAEKAQELADGFLNLTLIRDFPENPNEHGGMTWVVTFTYENGAQATVYHFGNLFVRSEDGPWYKLTHEESSRLDNMIWSGSD